MSTSLLLPFDLPLLPRGVSASPLFLQNIFLPESIHGLPITSMLEGSELLAPRELGHRLTLPDAVISRNDVKDRACQHEESTVDPASVAGRLLVKSVDAIVALMDLDRAEATLRQHGCHCGSPSMLLVDIES